MCCCGLGCVRVRGWCGPKFELGSINFKFDMKKEIGSCKRQLVERRNAVEDLECESEKDITSFDGAQKLPIVRYSKTLYKGWVGDRGWSQV